MASSALLAAQQIASTLSSAAAHQAPESSSNRQHPQVSEFDVLELTQQQLRQIQIAESAVNEMRVALNQHKASDVVLVTTGEGSATNEKP